MTTASDPPVVDFTKAEKTTPKAYNTTPGRFHFALRRVHSLMGLAFGGYICVHLLVNATGLWPRVYQQNVDHIHSLEPMLPLIELATIFAPLLIHAIYGIYITWAGVKFNTTKYNYGGNLRYSLQRWTAVLLLAFIAFHVGTLHRWGLAGLHDVLQHVHPLPQTASGQEDLSRFDILHRLASWCKDYGGRFNAHNQAFQTTVQGVRTFVDFSTPEDPHTDKLRAANVLVMAFYLVSIWAATFHFANGLWTSAIAWGLTVTANSQRRWGHVCLVFGITLGIVGSIAWYAFTLSPNAHGDMRRWNQITNTLPEEPSEPSTAREAPKAATSEPKP